MVDDYPLVMTNMAIENTLCMVDIPIQNGDCLQLCYFTSGWLSSGEKNMRITKKNPLISESIHNSYRWFTYQTWQFSMDMFVFHRPVADGGSFPDAEYPESYPFPGIKHQWYMNEIHNGLWFQDLWKNMSQLRLFPTIGNYGNIVKWYNMLTTNQYSMILVPPYSSYLTCHTELWPILRGIGG